MIEQGPSCLSGLQVWEMGMGTCVHQFLFYSLRALFSPDKFIKRIILKENRY